jgi:hypothetical protein
MTKQSFFTGSPDLSPPRPRDELLHKIAGTINSRLFADDAAASRADSRASGKLNASAHANRAAVANRRRTICRNLNWKNQCPRIRRSSGYIRYQRGSDLGTLKLQDCYRCNEHCNLQTRAARRSYKPSVAKNFTSREKAQAPLKTRRPSGY